MAPVALVGGLGASGDERGRETEEGEGMQRGRERREGTRGVVVARIRTKGGLQREAGGGRGSRARATPRLCLLAEEDDERRGGLRWWAGPPAGPAMGGGAKLGRFVAPGKLGFSLLFCFFSNYFSFLFCRFVLNLVLKPIQFILLLTIFLGAKRIKTMFHKNISELLDLYLFNSRYKSNSNNYDLNSKSQK